MTHDLLRISTSAGRWSGISPYYAMFPREFAFDVIENYSKVGQNILDPFAGRATSIYAAAVLKRHGYGIEINPVGWLYGKVKLNPAPKDKLLARNYQIAEIANGILTDELISLSKFFSYCYTENVLRYLLAARKTLAWKRSYIDATMMALILINLHGKRESSLSNQMRQGKAMHPDYSVRWWKEREMSPPDINPIEFMQSRIQWRYGKGTPELGKSKIILGDSTLKLKQLLKQIRLGKQQPFNLLFTSPPYYKVTDYYYDQWLRLWMLGGSQQPARTGEKWKGKFESMTNYKNLLDDVFYNCSRVMVDDAIIYVRTDARKFTFDMTKNTLEKVFPQHSMQILPSPFKKETQTALYGDRESKPGEVDIIMHP